MMRRISTGVLAFALAALALAQSPTDPNEGSQIAADPATGGYNFSWWGRAGRTYFIQQTDDLLTPWLYVPVIESGADSSLAWGFTSTSERFFVRLRYSDIPTANPFAADFDGDRVGNYQELLQGTDPLHWEDSDNDGIADDWEHFYFNLSGGNADPDADSDGDGLSNAEEFAAGTDPNSADSDGDGSSDSEELAAGTDPNKSDSDDDTVNDGADQYPLDPRRSRDVPPIEYISADLSTPIVGDADIRDVRIDDASKVGFFYDRDPDTYRTLTWKTGATTSDTTLARVQTSGNWETTYDPVAVSPSGYLAGNWSKSWLGDPDSEPVDECHGGGFLWSGTGTPTVVGQCGDSVSGLTINNIVLGSFYDYPFGTFIGGNRFPNGEPRAGFSFGYVSPAGKAPGTQSLYPYDGTNDRKTIWNGTGFIFPFGTEDNETLYAALNDSMAVFGWSPHFTNFFNVPTLPADGLHPFLIQGGTPKDFYEHLPERYRKQVYFPPEAPPGYAQMNSNGDVLFSAKVLVGEPEEWVAATLLWNKAAGTLHQVAGPVGKDFNKSHLGVDVQYQLAADQSWTRRANLTFPFQVEYLSRNPVEEQTTIQLPGGSLYESDATPTVKLTCQSASIDAETGALTVTVHCEIRDYASALQRSDSGKLDELKFIVDGEVRETLSDFSGLKQPDVVPVWQPYGEKIIVDRTFTISQSRAGVHTVVALTGENPASRQGWDTVAVRVGLDDSGEPIVLNFEKRPLHTPPPAAMSPVVCRILTADAIADWLTGPDAPQFRLAGREVTLTRTGGVGGVAGEDIPPGLVALYVADPENPVGGAEDPRLFFFAENSSDLAWAESSASWNLEVQWAPTSEWVTLDDRQMIFLAPNERMGEPLQPGQTLALEGQAQETAPQEQEAAVTTLFTPPAAASSTTAAPTAAAPAAATWGYDEFFLFLEIIYGPVERQVAQNLKDEGKLALVPVSARGGVEVEHNIPSDPEPLLIKVDSGHKTPADAAIAFHEAIKGRWIGKINYQELRVAAAASLPDGDMELVIEMERFNQGFTEFAASLTVAAAENYIRFLPYTGGGIVIDINEGFEQWQQGNKKTVAGMTAVTFVGAVVSHRLMAGKPVRIKVNGVEDDLAGDAGKAIGRAGRDALLQGKAGLLGRVELLRDLEPQIAAGTISPQQMERWIQGGLFSREHWSQIPAVDPTPGFFSRFFLRKTFEPYDVLGFGILKAQGKIPADAPFDEKKAWNQFRKFFPDHRRHHDLPNAQEFREYFIRVGLDPNDGEAFGRAVRKATHGLWHKQKHKVWIDGVETVVDFGSGGPFNAAWKTFRAGKPDATAGEIREFLQQLRTGPVTIRVGEGGNAKAFNADFSAIDNFVLELVP
jgi:hypothetical protein